LGSCQIVGDDVDAVGDRQIAAGRQAIDQPAHDRLRLVVIGDMAEASHEQQRDGLGEIERLSGLLQNSV
jgi:hypothetical protein